MERETVLRNFIRKAENSLAESRKAAKKGKIKSQSDDLKFAAESFLMASSVAEELGKNEALSYVKRAIKYFAKSAMIYLTYVRRKRKEHPISLSKLALHYKRIGERYERAASISQAYEFKEIAQKYRRSAINCYARAAKLVEMEMKIDLRFAVDRYFDIAFNHFLSRNLSEAVKVTSEALRKLESYGYVKSGWHIEAEGLSLLAEAEKRSDASMLNKALELLLRAEKAHLKEGEFVAAGRVREIRESLQEKAGK